MVCLIDSPNDNRLIPASGPEQKPSRLTVQRHMLEYFSQILVNNIANYPGWQIVTIFYLSKIKDDKNMK